MTEAGFRRIALGLDDAVEGAHMGHPDFRAGGRIFATLRGDGLHGMVKLTPEQQELFLGDHPAMFEPESGAWGRQGCTRVLLKHADDDVVGEAMTLAWRNAMSAPTKKARPRRSPAPRARRKKR